MTPPTAAPLLLVGLLGAGLLGAATLAAEPAVNIQLHTYPVNGATLGEIRSSMTANNPMHARGLRYDAYIVWRVDWRFLAEHDGRACRVSRVTTNVDIHYTFPRLQPDRRRSARVAEQWKRFTKALAIHELGHKEFAIGAAEALERTLPTLPGEASCAEMSERADAVGGRIIERFTELDRAYDRNTDHGRTQGAHFP